MSEQCGYQSGKVFLVLEGEKAASGCTGVQCTFRHADSEGNGFCYRGDESGQSFSAGRGTAYAGTDDPFLRMWHDDHDAGVAPWGIPADTQTDDGYCGTFADGTVSSGFEYIPIIKCKL